MIDLKPFEVCRMHSNELAFYKNIPIDMLEDTKSSLRARGIKKFRIRFRGPRKVGQDLRDADQRQRTCLKLFANRFSVYIK